MEPRLKIFITVEADDNQIFAGEYYSIESMEEDLYKAEKVIKEWQNES